MKDPEIILTTRAVRLRVHPAQQVSVPFGVKYDDHLMIAGGVFTSDILDDEQLRQTGLAHAGGAYNEHMSDPFAEIVGHRRLIRLDAVINRAAADRRQWSKRVERHICTG